MAATLLMEDASDLPSPLPEERELIDAEIAREVSSTTPENTDVATDKLGDPRQLTKCFLDYAVIPDVSQLRIREDSTVVHSISGKESSREIVLSAPRHDTRRPDTNSSRALAKPQAPSELLSHLSFAKAARQKRVYRHSTWELMRVISGHQGWVRCLAVDHSNDWFVSSGNDRLIKIWDLASGRLKLTLTGHLSTVRSLVISARHPYLFSCGEDKLVKCWDLEYNKVIRHYHGHLSGVYSMCLHPTYDVLATGGRDAVVRVWDMRTRQAIHVMSGHTGTVMSLVSQTSEPQIISGSLDKMVRCWDLRLGKSAAVLTHHKKAVRGLALHPKEREFCSAAGDHVKLWTCTGGETDNGSFNSSPDFGSAPNLNSPAAPLNVSFDRNLQSHRNEILNSIVVKEEGESPLVVCGSDQGRLIFWDWHSGQIVQELETIPQPGSLDTEKAIFDLKFDMSETRLFTAECDKTIKVWRANS